MSTLWLKAGIEIAGYQVSRTWHFIAAVAHHLPLSTELLVCQKVPLGPDCC